MIYYILSSFINAITSVVLGVIIFNQSKTKVNIYFSLFAFSSALWSTAYFMWQIASDASTAIFWIKILTFFSVFIPFFYFYFTLHFLKIVNRFKYLLWLINIGALFFALLSLTPFMVSSVSEKMYFRFWPNTSWVYAVFILFFAFLSMFSFLLLLIYSKKKHGIKGKQARYMVFSVGVGFLGGATNFPLWFNIQIPPFANILVSFYVLGTFYAIAVYNLMNIKIILRKVTVSFFTMGFFLSAYAFVKWFFFVYYPSFAFYAESIALLVSLATVIRVTKYFYTFSNKYLFSAVYDTNKIMSEINEKVGFDNDLNNIYDKIYNILKNSFHFKSFGVLEYDKRRKTYSFEYSKGLKIEKKKTIKISDVLHKFFIVEGKSMVIGDLKKHHYNESTKDTIDFLDEIGISVLTPLNAKDKVIGLIVFGKKEAKELYTKEDIELIYNVGVKISSNIEYIRGYEKIVEQNKEMEKEIDMATRDLQNKNKSLSKLDKAKNSFINLASHQLRNPLFVIKGYLSMIQEGMFGANTKVQKEQLLKMSQSNESLIQLIEDLLNAERIKTGRLEFNFVKVNFDKIVEIVFNELRLNAKNKNLKFYLKKPKNPLPMIIADKVKLKQVIFNLVDNAIKYTEKGSVTVSYKKIGNKIRFCVSDSGKGISKYGITRLFKKFSRYTGQKLHVEGTGLGLYIAKQMIERHDGKIWVESAGEGRGTQFYFTIPLKQDKKKK